MIRIKDLKKRFDQNVVFDGLSLELGGKGFYAVTGPSGSGKTTLLRMIAGLDREYEGSITADGVISYVFQENRLLPELSAYGNVFEVCRDGQKTSSLLRSVGLGGDMDKYPAEMSGGMARRVAIARALAFPHDILLLDEPFNALDLDLRRRMCEDVIGVLRQTGTTTILVTHDPGIARHAERIVYLRDGKIERDENLHQNR